MKMEKKCAHFDSPSTRQVRFPNEIRSAGNGLSGSGSINIKSEQNRNDAISTGDNKAALKDLVDQGILSNEEYESWKVLDTLTSLDKTIFAPTAFSACPSPQKFAVNDNKKIYSDNNCEDETEIEAQLLQVDSFEEQEYNVPLTCEKEVIEQDIQRYSAQYVRNTAIVVEQDVVSNSATDGSYSSKPYHLLPVVSSPEASATKNNTTMSSSFDDEVESIFTVEYSQKQELQTLDYSCTKHRIIMSAVILLVLGTLCVVGLLFMDHMKEKTQSTTTYIEDEAAGKSSAPTTSSITNSQDMLIPDLSPAMSAPTASSIGTSESMVIPDLSPAMSAFYPELSPVLSRNSTIERTVGTSSILTSNAESMPPTFSPSGKSSSISVQDLFLVFDSLPSTPRPTRSKRTPRPTNTSFIPPSRAPITTSPVFGWTKQSPTVLEPSSYPKLITCNPGQMSLRLVIQTDGFPDDTRWTLSSQSNDTSTSDVKSEVFLFQHSPEVYWLPLLSKEYSDTPPNSQHIESHCLESGANHCYKLIVFDEHGDGMCCEYGSGYYSVYRDGDVLANEVKKFQDKSTVLFGNCKSL